MKELLKRIQSAAKEDFPLFSLFTTLAIFLISLIVILNLCAFSSMCASSTGETPTGAVAITLIVDTAILINLALYTLTKIKID